jgi:hypothetical protein
MAAPGKTGIAAVLDGEVGGHGVDAEVHDGLHVLG